MSSASRIFIISLFIIVLIGGAFAIWFFKYRFIESTDNAYINNDVSTISSQISGYIREIKVEDNSKIKKGDVLAIIDDKDYEVRLLEAKANFMAQQHAINANESKIYLQRSLIDQAQANIIASSADAVKAKKDLDRIVNLVKNDFVSKQSLDSANATSQKSGANLTKSQAELAAQIKQLKILEDEHNIEKAKLEKEMASLTLAENNLSYTIITAPIDGVVSNKTAKLGDYVRPGMPILSLVPHTHHAYIIANFKENQITNFRSGQKVLITIDAFPDIKLEGKIDSLSPATGAVFSILPPENATGNFTKIVQRVPVKIIITSKNEDKTKLISGLSVRVVVNTK